jgi:hypothetical protein
VAALQAAVRKSKQMNRSSWGPWSEKASSLPKRVFRHQGIRYPSKKRLLATRLKTKTGAQSSMTNEILWAMVYGKHERQDHKKIVQDPQKNWKRMLQKAFSFWGARFPCT